MLDTLRYSKRLQSAGVSQAQADAQAEALRDEIIETVATKAQLEGAEQRLGAEIKLLRSELSAVDQRLEAKIDGVEQRLSTELRSLRWMMGLSVSLSLASIGLMAGVLVKLL